MDSRVPQAIFATNLFASRYPDEHVMQWGIYEKETSKEERSGYFGKENVNYIRFLMKKEHELFLEMTENDLQMMSFER